MNNTDEVYLPAVVKVTCTIFMRDKVLQKSEAELQAYLDAIPNAARRQRWWKSMELGTASPDFAPVLYSLDHMLSDMKSSLNRLEWLADPDCTLADAALIPFLEQCSMSWPVRLCGRKNDRQLLIGRIEFRPVIL